MNKRLLLWTIGVTAALLTVTVVLLATAGGKANAAISSADAGQLVLSQYPGTLLEVARHGDRYAVQVQLEQGVYESMVDAYSGDIVALQRLSMLAAPVPSGGDDSLSPEHEPSSAPTPGSDPTPSPDPPLESPSAQPSAGSASGGSGTPSSTPKPSASKPPSHIGAQAAGRIALMHVTKSIPGAELDDIDFYERGKSGPYYLVEIDVDDGPDAIVQVHAISGTIMSIVWDDEDDD